VTWTFVVERESVAVVTDLHQTTRDGLEMSAPSAAYFRAIRVVRWLYWRLREQVQQIHQDQLLMLLFVRDTEPD
jgi:hypothetical protein